MDLSLLHHELQPGLVIFSKRVQISDQIFSLVHIFFCVCFCSLATFIPCPGSFDLKTPSCLGAKERPGIILNRWICIKRVGVQIAVSQAHLCKR